MIIKDDDKFFKMFVSPQTCDFCMRTNEQIMHVILHPVCRYDENKKMKIEAYAATKKCMKCIEEQCQ